VKTSALSQKDKKKWIRKKGKNLHATDRHAEVLSKVVAVAVQDVIRVRGVLGRQPIQLHQHAKY
jgi:hypothetical protein